MLKWAIWEPSTTSKNTSNDVSSDTVCHLRTESVLKPKISSLKLSKVPVLYQHHLPGQQMKPCFCFVSDIKRERKQYAILTGKQGRKHYRLDHLIHLPSWVSEIILLNKSWLSQEVNIMSVHQQFQQLGHPFRCQSINWANWVRNTGLRTQKQAASGLVAGINQAFYLLRCLR